MPRGSNTTSASLATSPANESLPIHCPLRMNFSNCSRLSSEPMSFSRSFANTMLLANRNANAVVIAASPPTCMSDDARSASAARPATPSAPTTAAPPTLAFPDISGTWNSGNSNDARFCASTALRCALAAFSAAVAESFSSRARRSAAVTSSASAAAAATAATAAAADGGELGRAFLDQLSDILAVDGGEESRELGIVDLRGDGSEDSLDVGLRGGVLASELRQQVSGGVLHLYV
mmetsp:Transcript_8510/g.35581  ORF Transcript_8510/g.35581 Transcript_8510/m.35581 type:complete len:235 (+) Transcript_8510:875-1579(+)